MMHGECIMHGRYAGTGAVAGGKFELLEGIFFCWREIWIAGGSIWKFIKYENIILKFELVVLVVHQTQVYSLAYLPCIIHSPCIIYSSWIIIHHHASSCIGIIMQSSCIWHVLHAIIMHWHALACALMQSSCIGMYHHAFGIHCMQSSCIGMDWHAFAYIIMQSSCNHHALACIGVYHHAIIMHWHVSSCIIMNWHVSSYADQSTFCHSIRTFLRRVL